MPSPKTYTFTPVPEHEAKVIRQGQSVQSEWFAQVMRGAMLLMSERPSVTSLQQEALKEQGRRLRTRRHADPARGVYVWTEEHVYPAPVLKSSEDETDPLSLVS